MGEKELELKSIELNKSSTPERKNESVILLRVHGITEAGKEFRLMIVW
jgi:hypothetical protein